MADHVTTKLFSEYVTENDNAVPNAVQPISGGTYKGVGDQLDTLNRTVKEPCVVATTANITLSGYQTIDGVDVTTQRVLVKEQTNPVENGIYVASATAWARTDDFKGDTAAIDGTSVIVTDGAINGGFEFYVASNGPVIIGTDPLTFEAVAGSAYGVPVGGTAGQFLAKASDADRDDHWVDSPVPSGGSEGQVLVQGAPDREWSFVENENLAISLQNALTGVASDRTVLSDMTGADYKTVNLIEANRQGIFDDLAGDFEALVAADTQQGIYVAKADDPSGSTSAWVRRYNYRVSLEDAGGAADSTGSGNGTDSTAAMKSLLAVGELKGGIEIIMPRSDKYVRVTDVIDIDNDSLQIIGSRYDSRIYCDHSTYGFRFGNVNSFIQYGLLSGVFMTGKSTTLSFLNYVGGAYASLVEDSDFVQNNPAARVWEGALEADTPHKAQMTENGFQRCSLYTTNAHTTYIVLFSSTKGARCNDNEFHRIRLHGLNSPGINYALGLFGNGPAAFQNNRISLLVGEQTVGGLINLSGCEGTLLDQPGVNDLSTVAGARNMIALNPGAAGVPTRGTVISQYFRAPGTLAAGRNDIYVDATSLDTVIIAPEARSAANSVGSDDLKINLNGTKTTLIGVPSTSTILNADAAIIPSVNVRGSWTPTLTGVDNVTSTTASVCYYARQGDQVQCWGSLVVTPTAGTIETTVGISLPIASAMTSGNDASGVASGSVAGTNGLIEGDATNDRAQLRFTPPGTSAYTIKFEFSYKILS